MKSALLLILFASILATFVGVSVLYLNGPILLRAIVAGVFIVPGFFGFVGSFSLLLEEL